MEAIYFKKPIVVNTYSIYSIDIKPKNFKVIEIDGYVTDKAVRETIEVLKDKKLRDQMVEENYRKADTYYSYDVLYQKLKNLIADCTICAQFSNKNGMRFERSTKDSCA